MHHPRPPVLLLAALSLLLALGAAPLLAQTDSNERTENTASATAKDQEAGDAAGSPAPAAGAEKKGNDATTGKSSPFDYRASEQISEDVPVSFPVDI
jgi:predicted cobalt transporter CbtA